MRRLPLWLTILVALGLACPAEDGPEECTDEGASWGDDDDSAGGPDDVVPCDDPYDMVVHGNTYGVPWYLKLTWLDGDDFEGRIEPDPEADPIYATFFEGFDIAGEKGDDGLGHAEGCTGTPAYFSLMCLEQTTCVELDFMVMLGDLLGSMAWLCGSLDSEEVILSAESSGDVICGSFEPIP